MTTYTRANRNDIARSARRAAVAECIAYPAESADIWGDYNAEYGDPRRATAKAIRTLRKYWLRMNGKRTPYLVEYGVIDPDYGCDRGTQTDYYTLRDAVEVVRNHPEYVDSITSEAGVREFVQYEFENNSNVAGCFVFTPEEYETHQAEEEMTRLEGVAHRFAAHCGAKIGTMEFVRSLIAATTYAEGEREQYNSLECQMEEYAAHQYAGCTHEYYNNRDFTNGRYSDAIGDLYGVRQWLESQCPLLMAKVKEEELSATED